MMWKPDMSASDLRWRSELAPDCRPRQFHRILETLKTCFPNCASVDLDELNEMTNWLEEETYTDATSHTDYLYKVYLKILNMKTRFQTTAASHGMQSQVHNGHSQISLPNQSQARQSQNAQNTIVSAGAQSSASLPPALPSMTTQTSVPNAAGQRINMQSGIAQNFVGSSVSQGLPSNIFSNAQWRPGWNQLQQFSSQQQQLLQHQLMKQNLLQPTQMSNAVGRSTNTQSEMAHAQYLFQQQQQQHQLMNPQLFSSSMNSNAQTGQNAVDWQEEIYQKIQSMKQNYLPYLNEIHHEISKECQQLKRNFSGLNVPQCESQKLLNLLKSHIHVLNVPKKSIVPAMKDMLTAYETPRTASVLNVPRCEKQNLFNLLESRIQILNVPKNIIVPAMKDVLSVYEKQVIHLINSNWPRKPVSAQQQIQQPGGHPLSTQPQQQQEQEEADNQQQQQEQQEEEVDNQPDATHEIIDVTGPKTADSSD